MELGVSETHVAVWKISPTDNGKKDGVNCDFLRELHALSFSRLANKHTMLSQRKGLFQLIFPQPVI